MNELIKQDETTRRVMELIVQHREAGAQDEATRRMAAIIAAQVEREIDELIGGKIVVTRDELHKVQTTTLNALRYLESAVFRTVSERLWAHGFRQQGNGKWRRPASRRK
jgi:hypothetical protein